VTSPHPQHWGAAFGPPGAPTPDGFKTMIGINGRSLPLPPAPAPCSTELATPQRGLSLATPPTLPGRHQQQGQDGVAARAFFDSPRNSDAGL